MIETGLKFVRNTLEVYAQPWQQGNMPAHIALEVLDDVLAELRSDRLVAEVAQAIRATPVDDAVYAAHEYIEGSEVLAKAAIKVIRG